MLGYREFTIGQIGRRGKELKGNLKMGHIPGKACSQDWGWKRNQNLGYAGRETKVEGNREQNLPEGRGRGIEVLTGARAWMIASNMGGSLQ